MNLKLEPDTTKLLLFIGTCAVILFFVAIINTSFKNHDASETSNKLEWGNKLLVGLVVVAFGYTAYTLQNLYMFVASLLLIMVMVV
jgi:glucose uptake protein GlcU